MALVPLKTGVCRSGVRVFGSLKDRCVQVRGLHVWFPQRQVCAGLCVDM